MELRLSGTTVQMLMDNAHIRRGNGPADASDVTDPADLLLNRAATRWYRAAKCVRMGKGWQYRGPVQPGEAAYLLDYIDSVAGALEGAEDAEGRQESRTYRVQVEKARLVAAPSRRCCRHRGRRVRYPHLLRLRQRRRGRQR